ncbi:MAG: RNA-binding protein [Candidatus Omnitrophica bacterium]|nr:RNA-binding protein [Candidatus Omnitrophota bacterium]
MVDKLKFRRRHRLKRKEVKNLLKNLFDAFNTPLPITTENIEIAVTDFEYEIIFIENKLTGFIFEEKPFLTLRGILEYRPTQRSVTVDMGAIKFVSNGADVMAPGIVDADRTITSGDLVWVKDERHHQPLAVGEALMSGSEMIDADSGKAVKMIHHIGDELWNCE